MVVYFSAFVSKIFTLIKRDEYFYIATTFLYCYKHLNRVLIAILLFLLSDIVCSTILPIFDMNYTTNIEENHLNTI